MLRRRVSHSEAGVSQIRGRFAKTVVGREGSTCKDQRSRAEVQSSPRTRDTARPWWAGRRGGNRDQAGRGLAKTGCCCAVSDQVCCCFGEVPAAVVRRLQEARLAAAEPLEADWM